MHAARLAQARVHVHVHYSNLLVLVSTDKQDSTGTNGDMQKGSILRANSLGEAMPLAHLIAITLVMMKLTYGFCVHGSPAPFTPL
jgi:hypothetical protein